LLVWARWEDLDLFLGQDEDLIYLAFTSHSLVFLSHNNLDHSNLGKFVEDRLTGLVGSGDFSKGLEVAEGKSVEYLRSC
jgi:hypothetical protein